MRSDPVQLQIKLILLLLTVRVFAAQNTTTERRDNDSGSGSGSGSDNNNNINSGNNDSRKDNADAEAKDVGDGDADGDSVDSGWLRALRALGWHPSMLKNKIEQHDVTTFELGLPNYEILNPDDQPTILTRGQPEYSRTLSMLTANENHPDELLAFNRTSLASETTHTSSVSAEPEPEAETTRVNRESVSEKEKEEPDAVEFVFVKAPTSAVYATESVS